MTPPLIVIVLSRLDRGIQSATEMLSSVEKAWGQGVAHSFPHMAGLCLANALVETFVAICFLIFAVHTFSVMNFFFWRIQICMLVRNSVNCIIDWNAENMITYLLSE